MALFNGNTRIEGSRSHTHLVKSGHMSPAEKWLISPKFKDPQLSSVFTDGVLMNYEYGGDGFSDVVIPMGRIVGVAEGVKDFVSKKVVTTIALPGMATEGNTIGVVPYNICKDYFQQDRFGGNAPAVITLDYITLPYIPSVAPAVTMDMAGVLQEEKALSVDLKMPWGAAIGLGIVEGSYLKATASGRFTKWDKETDHACDIVAQVLAVDMNAEMWGWYKWMLWDSSVRHEDDMYINRSGVSNLPSDTGYPFDPSYPDGNTIWQNYQSQFLTNPTGVPNIHDGEGNFDGFGRNDTEYADVELGTVGAGLTEGTVVPFQALDLVKQPLQNLQSPVVVKIDGTEIAQDRVHVNHRKGVIYIKTAVADAGKTVSATYKALHYGTPDYLDFKGVVGAIFAVLKK